MVVPAARTSRSIDPESIEVDVTVVGGGPAGSAAAIALARRGLSVLLLEARAEATWRIGETLPPHAAPLIAELGLLDTFESDRHLPSYGNLSAWGSTELVETDFIFNPHGNGWQLDRARFDARLAELAERAGSVLWQCATPETVASRAEGGWEVKIIHGDARRTARSRRVVDATGRRCRIARQLGARVRAIDGLVCVYAVASGQPGLPPDQDTRTLVEAVPEGWWYTALMPGGRRTVALLCDPESIGGQQWRAPGWFRSAIEATRHVRGVLERHGYVFPEPARSTSARSARLEPWCGPDWLAVGDAAMSFDPLSSLGLVSALLTGREAGLAIARSLEGDATAFARYTERLNDIWETYLRDRLRFYRDETRWPELPFWRRRRS
jgi:flavin-dependent dehydrogenase